jgi:hypothetical protein
LARVNQLQKIKYKTMKQNKYKYLAVIQQNYGFGWEDNSEYETDSKGNPIKYEIANGIYISNLRHDYKEYKMTGYSTRIIKRKELNK